MPRAGGERASRIAAITPNYRPVADATSRKELRKRYAVRFIEEDAWHAVSGERAAEFVARSLPRPTNDAPLLLNAGCGGYSIGAQSWDEIPVDLFEEPLVGKTSAVCANIEFLPFRTASFGAITCIGEVLGYCDPAAALAEFSRVLASNGILICDFGSTTSARHWLTRSFGKATALVTDTYNNHPEVLWNYSPDYIRRLLRRNGFEIKRVRSSHTVSAVARRCGVPLDRAAALERRLGQTLRFNACADLILISARKV